jgi:hypothetical protein
LRSTARLDTVVPHDCDVIPLRQQFRPAAIAAT